MEFLLFLLPFILISHYPRFHRWAFYPSREPDFEHRLYVYWFDEMIAYGKLTTKKRLKFYESGGYLFEDLGSNQKFAALFNQTTMLPMEVQEAYKQHLHKKFEEIVLK